MEYIHVRNIERYHPGYMDRKLIWGKIYFDLIHGDPEFEMITNEIDKWRYVAFILLELSIQQNIPLDEKYLLRKGFDLSARSITTTLQVLHNFVEIVTQNSQICYLDKSRVDIYRNTPEVCNKKKTDKKTALKTPTDGLLHYFCDAWYKKIGRKYTPSYAKDKKIIKDLLKTHPVDVLETTIDRFFKEKNDFAEKGGYTVGIFKSQFNRLLAQPKGRIKVG